jgi:hypothetical protein
MAFLRREHEFLRLLAADSTTPEVLGNYAEDLDWAYLWKIAGEHQLDGILAWRCLQTEILPHIPEAAARDGATHQANLSAVMSKWVEEAAQAAKLFRDGGVRWYCVGTPSQYALYPDLGSCWPRALQEFEVAVHPEDYEKAIAIAAPYSHPMHAPWELRPSFHLPSGLEVHVDCAPLAYATLTAELLPAQPVYFDYITEADVFGLTLPALRPEAAIVPRGFLLHNRLTGGGPIPFADLAWVANLMGASAELDWTVTAHVLEAARQQMLAAREVLQALAGGPFDDKHLDYLLGDSENFSALSCVVWAWEFVDRVYGVPQPPLEMAREQLGKTASPSFRMQDGYVSAGPSASGMSGRAMRSSCSICTPALHWTTESKTG